MDLIIGLNKPKDITSQDATSEVKKILKVKKAGHTGTLDPMATGLLLICTNKATRIASYLSSLDKEYKAVMKLGEATDTQDLHGSIITKSDKIEIDEVAIKNALESFKGEIVQKPPKFSALKYRGKPLYEYARKGLDIPRKPRKVYIHHLELLNIDLPFVSFRAVCSKGTYIRTLCDDIGKKLGIGAHLFELERTAIGPFHIKDALGIEELNSFNNHFEGKGIYTMDRSLSWMPELRIKKSQIKAVKNGIPIKISHYPDLPQEIKTATDIRIKSPDGRLLAIGRLSANKDIIKMDVVFGN
jgi:tRNA pseudouridine55 synthase